MLRTVINHHYSDQPSCMHINYTLTLCQNRVFYDSDQPSFMHINYILALCQNSVFCLFLSFLLCIFVIPHTGIAECYSYFV